MRKPKHTPTPTAQDLCNYIYDTLFLNKEYPQLDEFGRDFPGAIDNANQTCCAPPDGDSEIEFEIPSLNKKFTITIRMENINV